MSGKWTILEKRNHINTLELKAIWLALREVPELVQGKTIAVFGDNTTALSYISKQGGTKSWTLFRLVEEIFLWLEELQITLVPQFIQGARNTVADSLSRRGQVLPTEWMLHLDVCKEIYSGGVNQWSIFLQPA